MRMDRICENTSFEDEWLGNIYFHAARRSFKSNYWSLLEIFSVLLFNSLNLIADILLESAKEVNKKTLRHLFLHSLRIPELLWRCKRFYEVFFPALFVMHITFF